MTSTGSPNRSSAGLDWFDGFSLPRKLSVRWRRKPPDSPRRRHWSWLDAEVLTDDHGKPSFKIMGTVAARAAELGIGTIHLSMSHDAGIASAVVICEA